MKLYVKVAVFVLLLLLPLNLVALSVTQEAVDTALEQMTMTDRQFAEISMESLSGRMSNAISLMYFFTRNNADCIQMMRQSEDYLYLTSKYSFFVTLKELAHMTDGADGYFFFLNEKEDVLLYCDTSATDFFRETALPEVVSQLPRQRWRICTIESTTCLIFSQESGNTVYGAWIDLDQIRNSLTLGFDFAPTEVLFSQGNEAALDKEWVSGSATKHRITLTVAQRREDVLHGISPKAKILYAVSILYFVAAPVLCGFVYLNMLKPLNTVTKANREIQKGNLNYRIAEKGRSPEFDEVFQSFNAMAQDLQQTKIECYDKEVENQKIELQNLQLQIRPHFLLNHFNLIYTLVQRNEIAQVEETILYLSEYFRFLFRSGRDTEPFGKELQIIQGYLRVANIRYRNQICAEIDVTAETEKVYLPPLLIHNFVENTIKHGVRTETPLHILVKGRFEGNEVTFLIEDDGNGMDEQMLERTRRIFSGELNLDNQNEHIGIYNSYKRLKAFGGAAASIEVDSRLGRGTRFTIRFPYDAGEAGECQMRGENE